MFIDTGINILKIRKISNAEIRSFTSRFKTVLTYSNNKVKAEYYNYLNELQDYNSDIIFDLEGEQITIQAINGTAEIDFTSTFPGQYIVKTVNQDISNGSVIINVE